MSATSETQSGTLEELAARCQQLHLNGQEFELLKDLLGWNNMDGSVPKSYGGIEPQLSVRLRHKAAKPDEAPMAEYIATLIRRLLGYERMGAVIAKPIETLQGQLALPRDSVLWLVAQLRLHAAYAETQEEINSTFGYHPAFTMLEMVVVDTLCILLQPNVAGM